MAKDDPYATQIRDRLTAAVFDLQRRAQEAVLTPSDFVDVRKAIIRARLARATRILAQRIASGDADGATFYRVMSWTAELARIATGTDPKKTL